jgi:cytochrome c nitrite reductase small subunit
MRARHVFAALLIIVPGVLVGVSGYTFVYAKGYSYLLNDPKACMNCHVMRDNYQAWQVSPHRFATCNDCHVPHNFVGKYAAKAEHGMRHSYVFTFGDPQVIRIKPSGRAIVESNCVRCHAMTVSSIVHGGENNHRCFDCHRGMGHAQ